MARRAASPGCLPDWAQSILQGADEIWRTWRHRHPRWGGSVQPLSQSGGRAAPLQHPGHHLPGPGAGQGQGGGTEREPAIGQPLLRARL